MLPFCEHCHDIVHYYEKVINKTKSIKGKEISYIGKEAYCNECQTKVFVTEIRDFNLKQLDEVYRETEGLIKISEIEDIIEKYNVGKRPLSVLLGWGEGTVTRYLNGDIPTKPYSEMLKKLLNDHHFMNELLEKNKSKISNHAYDSVKRAIEKMQTPLSLEKEKMIDLVARYLLYKCVDITPLALQKLLYYAQSFHVAFHGEYLFEDDCEAWVHGPVYRAVYYKYKSYGYDYIEGNINENDFLPLTQSVIELLDSLITNFGCYSGKILEEMTHLESPWRITRKGLGEQERSEKIINKDLIVEYFDHVKTKYQMLNYSDIRDYSSDLFKKIHSLE